MVKSVIVGIGAGLVSALLLMSIGTGTPVGVMLALLSAVPGVIAGLGWGAKAALAAALVAAGVPLAFGAPMPALVHLVAIGAPTVAFSHYTLLWRQDAATGEREWYPIGRILAGAAVWAAVIGALMLLQLKSQLGASDVADLIVKVKPHLAETAKQFERFMGKPVGEEDLVRLAQLSIVMLTGLFGSVWLNFMLANAYLAGKVTALSGRLARPWPDLSELRLPRLMPVAYFAAVLLTYAGDVTGLIASGFVSTFTFAYLLVGLAILHNTTRGTPVRGAILAAAYLSLLFLNPIATPVLALIGLAEPISPLRRGPPKPPAPPAPGPGASGHGT